MAFGSISVDRIVDSEGSVFSPSSVSFRNRIINGDMRIDQRNAGAAVTVNNEFEYTLDRWECRDDTDGDFTVQQVTDAPSGFVNSLKVTTTTADATLTTTQAAFIDQRIEGLNVADLAWGTASAKTVTLSFWVRSSLTGTFGGSFQNSAQNRAYPFTYTISAADTWEQKTITVLGDTSGTWLTTNGTGIRVNFGLGVGPDRSGTANAWNSNSNFSATGAVSVIGTLNATWYITGVQLEVGSVATPFERRPYGTELSLCQRYYYRNTGHTALTGAFGSGYNDSTSAARFYTAYPTTMRASPTLDSSAANTFNVTNTGAAVLNMTTVTAGAIGPTGALIFLTGGSGLVAGQGCLVRDNNNTGTFLAFSAEL
jgi:hypothetical protein